MEIILETDKSLEENAAVYFDKAKKSKKKLEGAKKALEKTAKRKEKKLEQKRKVSTKKEWFQKFHWCYTSKGKLMIGGRDATTNEIIIKKHSESNDLAFHTDMKGSPFVILKDGSNASEEELLEAASICLSYSQGWKKGMAIEVFYVKPEQLSKQGKAGEAAPAKGGFVVLGETNYLHPNLEFAIGVFEDKIMGGPIKSVKSNCKHYFEIMPGEDKSSEVAKKIAKKLDYDDLDEIIRTIPPGGCKLGKFI